MDEDGLRARFSLVEIDDEGVLLDRESGAVYRLNRTACDVWSALFAGDSIHTIAATLSRRFGIAPHLADRDATAALVDLPHVEMAQGSGAGNQNNGRWQMTSDGYALIDQRGIVCEVDRRGTSVRLPQGQSLSQAEARARLRSVAPRVLALRGIHLLHASAVEVEGTLLVFTGPSGAGKTTTARSFARNGARLISEDLLVLGASSTTPRAIISGEATIRNWVHDQAAHLSKDPVGTIGCYDLDASARGADLPVSKILVIDAGRRFGERIRLDRLTRAGALVAMMNSIYFASVDADSWLARIEMLRNVVTFAHTSIATMPSGLSALEEAIPALNQSEMMAS